REPVFGYEAVRAARAEEERAERLRLYYVAMTRAVDRLIVSGAIDLGREAERSTPIGWVLDRLGAAEDLAAGGEEPFELERGGARFVVRVDRSPPAEEPGPGPAPELAEESGQLALFAEIPAAPARPLAPRLPALEPVPLPPLH